MIHKKKWYINEKYLTVTSRRKEQQRTSVSYLFMWYFCYFHFDLLKANACENTHGWCTTNFLNPQSLTIFLRVIHVRIVCLRQWFFVITVSRSAGAPIFLAKSLARRLQRTCQDKTLNDNLPLETMDSHCIVAACHC